MKKYFSFEAFTIGLAMFSMFFGAGNVIFPLAVGQFAGDKNLFAMSGLIMTAAIMPIAGVIAMILFDGNIRHFFGRIGRVPGFLLATLAITLLGPLGSTPRCKTRCSTCSHCSALSTVPIHSPRWIRRSSVNGRSTRSSASSFAKASSNRSS